MGSNVVLESSNRKSSLGNSFIRYDLAVWIKDFVVGDATLNRFFTFHVIAIPFVIAGLVVAHIVALHEVGSNNPDGVEIKKEKIQKGSS